MRLIVLLLAMLCCLACKKEKTYGPLNLRDGQEVELLVDHRYASESDILLKLPEKQPAGAALVGFDEREPGYTYTVKAVFHNEDNPPQDGSAYSFEFKSVISKEQYKGNEAFTIQMILSYVPGGPTIFLRKVGSDYYYIPEKVKLTYTDVAISNQLEEIWQDAQAVQLNWQSGQQPKWRSIKATVTHDPLQFGKAYRVQQLQFTP